nr:unnamed protein product [Spirometra erinaceieuropaei]
MSVKGQTQRPSFVDGSISEQQTFIDSDGESMSRRRSPNAIDSGSEAYLYSDSELLGTWGSKNRKANTSTGTAVTNTSVTLSAAASTSDGSNGQVGKTSGPSSTSYASLPSYVSSLLTGSTSSTAGSGMQMAARSKGTPTIANFSAVTTPTTTASATFGGAANVSDGTQSFLKQTGQRSVKETSQATTLFAADEDIQEGNLVVFLLLLLLHHKLNVREDGVEMIFECQHLIPFDDDGVIYIPSPKFRSVVSENQQL